MNKGRRLAMTLAGVALSGIGCGFIKTAMFGTDPYTGFITGLSQLSGAGYGNIYAIVNFAVFIAVWFLDQHYIGIATLINMVGAGYVVQFTSGLLSEGMERAVYGLALSGVGTGLLQAVFFLAGLFILSIGTALYFTADLGVSTYDAAALILRDRSKVSLKACRMGTDLFCVVLALVLGASIGVGTVVTAFCLGPFIEFFNGHVAIPLLRGKRPVSAG